MPPLRIMSSMHFSMAATTRSGPALARRGTLFPADDLARLADQRGLHLRAADVHAQIEPLSLARIVVFFMADLPPTIESEYQVA